jgi:predicted amidohydrolase
MARKIIVGSAQLGPIARSDTRSDAVARLLELLRRSKSRGCRLVVFPELALTTFFPRWYMEDPEEVDAFFETEMPGAETKPLFEEAARLEIGFYLGYAELADEGGERRHFNTSVLVDPRGRIIGKYRKVHLPGHDEHVPQFRFQHLEKRYFLPGDLGFPVWRAFDGIVGMCICNDRRWPETFRVMGLQGVELVMLGYNTPIYDFAGFDPSHLKMLHHRLSLQSGAYQNATWVVATAKAGREEGSDLIGGSCIVAPTGEIVAESKTLGDELIIYDCDLDLGGYLRAGIMNFERNRMIEHYQRIATQRGTIPPAEDGYE